MAKTKEEQLQEVEEKLVQLKARKQRIKAQMREKERKERTRRLIQIGAIFEKYFDLGGVEEAEQVAKMFADTVKRNKEVATTKEEGEASHETART